jgi:hypothetical protein
MRENTMNALIVTVVAGLFGLVPLMVQIATSRAQQRDRMTRLNQLRAELELLERLHTLQGEVSATDDAAKAQTNRVISDSLRRLLEQYDQLSEIAPPAISGSKQPSPQQLSFLRRAFLLYEPRSISGRILHTLFYMLASIVPLTLLVLWPSFSREPSPVSEYLFLLFFFTPLYIVLVIIQRFARRNAAKNAAQVEDPTP